MYFKGLLTSGIVLLALSALFWLIGRRFPQSDSPQRASEQSFLRRYVAFEAQENGLLALPFLLVGLAAFVIGAIGLLVT